MTSEPLAVLEPALAALRERPGLISELRRDERGSLLTYLADWGPAHLLLACADALIEGSPRLIVSSLDLRARALLALGRPDEATEAVRLRLERKDSLTGRLLLVRSLLAAGDADACRAAAEAMVAEEPTATTGWQALAEVELAVGAPDAALAALHRLGEVVPRHRAYLLGMARAHAARRDWVTATSFAVGLIEAAAERFRLEVEELRQLGELFRAAGEVTRAADIAEQLADRRAEDGEALVAALAEWLGHEAPMAVAPTGAEPAEAVRPTGELPPVSAEERERIAAAARALFGFGELLPGQVETIACALRGESVLTILPTGGGKSLCFQLPAFLDEAGVTLVVSPLIALMQDQWQHVPEALRHQATFVNSQLEGDELNRRVAAIAAGESRLVYAAPERLRQPPFMHALRRAGVNRMVIDEAHCVSAWGHDFRPEYLALAEARARLGQPPVLALTATAPERVRRDVLRQLGDMRVVATDPRRPNLRFDVMRAADADAKYRLVVELCADAEGCGIVYAGMRDRCEELAAVLRRQGVSAEHYHAGVADRSAVQDRFMAGETRVMVATNAFGMGVDKQDVRFVLHFVAPDSVESYYQEAGRGGRDGLPARCVLLYAPADKATLTRHANRDDIPVEFLRSLYAAVRGRLHGAASGRVAVTDLLRELATDDEVRLRAGLGILGQAGLLNRGPDVPRTVSLMLTPAGSRCSDAALVAIREAARLEQAHLQVVDPVAVARDAGIAPGEIEPMLLQWQGRDWLRYRPSGRDMLLALPPAPEDSPRRIGERLEILASVRKQRVSDIVAYAETHRCRHGYLAQYLGGLGVPRCDACDNCVPLPPPPACLPDEAGQAWMVLRCLADTHGWGLVNLIRILRGDSEAPAAALGWEGYGSLGFRSDGGVKSLIARLEEAGLLERRQLENGGTMLALTAKGARAARDPVVLRPSVAPRPPVHPRAAAEDGEAATADEALLQRLRAWRARQARADGVAPFMVLHDAHLKAIAAASPRTLEALGRVRGIGPAKLARYGEALLALVGGEG